MPGPNGNNKPVNSPRRDYAEFKRGQKTPTTLEHSRPYAISKKQIPKENEAADSDRLSKEWVEKHAAFNCDKSRSRKEDIKHILRAIVDTTESEWTRYFIPGHPKTALVGNQNVDLNSLTNESEAALAVRSEKIKGTVETLLQKNYDLSKIKPEKIRTLASIMIAAILRAEQDLKAENILIDADGNIFNADHDLKKIEAQFELFHTDNINELREYFKSIKVNYNFTHQDLESLPNLCTNAPKYLLRNENLPNVEINTFTPNFWVSDRLNETNEIVSRRINTVEELKLTAEQLKEFNKQKLRDMLKVMVTPDALAAEIRNNAVCYADISYLEANYETGEFDSEDQPILERQKIMSEAEFNEFIQRLHEDDRYRRRLFIKNALKLSEFREFYEQELGKAIQHVPSVFDEFAQEFVNFQQASKSNGTPRYWPAVDKAAILNCFIEEAKNQRSYFYYEIDIRKWIDGKALYWYERRGYRKLLEKAKEAIEKHDVSEDYKTLYLFANFEYRRIIKNYKNNLRSQAFHFVEFGNHADETQVIRNCFFQLNDADLKSSIQQKIFDEFALGLNKVLFSPSLSTKENAQRLKIEFRNAWLRDGSKRSGAHPVLKRLLEKLENISGYDDQIYLLYTTYLAAHRYDPDSQLTFYLQNALGASLSSHMTSFALGGKPALDKHKAIMDHYEKFYNSKKQYKHIMVSELENLVEKQSGWVYWFKSHFIIKAWSRVETEVENLWDFAELMIDEKQWSNVSNKAGQEDPNLPNNLHNNVSSFTQTILQLDAAEDNSQAPTGSAPASEAGTSSDDERLEKTVIQPIENNPQYTTKCPIAVITKKLSLFCLSYPEIYPKSILQIKTFLNQNTVDDETKAYFLWVLYEAAHNLKGNNDAAKLTKILRDALMLQITDNINNIWAHTKKRDAMIAKHFSDYESFKVDEVDSKAHSKTKFNKDHKYYLETKNAAVTLGKEILDYEAKQSRHSDFEQGYGQKLNKLFSYILYKDKELAFFDSNDQVQNHILQNEFNNMNFDFVPSVTESQVDTALKENKSLVSLKQ